MNALIIASCLLLAQGPTPNYQQQARTNKVYCVGDICVIGNERTPDGDILEALQLYPGQYLPTKKELQLTELKLWMRYRKEFDLRYGYRPTIEIRKYDDSQYVTVTVIFPETIWKKR